jgi:hypothetical protein
VSGIFFPQRIPLKIDGSPASPAVLEKKVLAAAHAPSYTIGELLLNKLGGIDLTGRSLNKTALKIGTEMIVQRDARLKVYLRQPLPRQRAQPVTPIRLACVSTDGGRMQTRDEGGPGVHHPHWRENKNALFLRMESQSFDLDPHPELPACFADPQQMKQLLSGLTEELAAPAVTHDSLTVQPLPAEDWRPEKLFRTCLSSLADSDTFGWLMEIEADARGFYHAQKKAYVSDGLPYNWTIHERHFRDFTPILDFVHAVERLYEAARSVHTELDLRWADYLRWARAGWRGEIQSVLDELRLHQQRLGLPPEKCDPTDPRKLLADALGYFENNASRMKYPEYRRQGLPTTSAHMESLVKEINARVKGTEKFWNDGTSAEAILQIRAAALCDDDRLTKFLRDRPGNPFHPNAKPPSLATAT